MKNFMIKSDRRISSEWLIIVVILGSVAIFKVGGYFVSRVEAKELAEKILACHEVTDEKMDKYFSSSRELAKKLKAKSLFMIPKPDKNPIDNIQGILGQEVLINNKWYKEGDKVGEAEIMEVTACMVKVKWKDKEFELSPIKGAVSRGSGDEKSRVKKVDKRARRKNRTKAAAVEQAADSTQNSGDSEFSWLGVEVSERVLSRMKEHWSKMSDEEKQQARERWESLSQGEKEEIVSQMEQNL